MFGIGSVLVVEKMVGLAVVLAALTVGTATIMHGDLSLGLLVLLGQVQSMIHGHGHATHAQEETTHLVAHRRH